MWDKVELMVKATRLLTRDIRLIELADRDDWPLPPFSAGAHVDLHLPSGLVRPYSLCSDPLQARRWQVAVKRDPASRGGSAELHAGVAVGDRLRASLPRNHFPLVSARRHVMIAAGIGITPFLPMIDEITRRGVDFFLHMTARTGADLPFADRLRTLQAQGHARITLTAGGQPRIDVPNIISEALAAPDTHVYACGPESLIARVEASMWLAPGRVHFERFRPPSRIDTSADPAFRLELRRSGKVFDVPAGQSVLGALRAHGVAVNASCEGGVCNACRVRVLEGEVEHRDQVLGTADRECWMMACVSRPVGDRLVLDL